MFWIRNKDSVIFQNLQMFRNAHLYPTLALMRFQVRSQVWWVLGEQNAFLVGKHFVFMICLKQNIKKVSVLNKNLGALPPNAPRGHGRVRSCDEIVTTHSICLTLRMRLATAALTHQTRITLHLSLWTIYSKVLEA